MIKKLIPLAAGMLLPAMLYAATPTPSPTPSPTPAPRVIQDSDFRVPLGGVMLYGNNGGTAVKVKVNADGVIMTMPVPTPTP